MKSNSPVISVIVPVYNVEKYLHRCIDSILAQTFTDFELLLIDDGSKDNSGKICDEYAEKDKRIRVFHKENGGVSSARNVGLENAKGDWICFADSDDWMNENWVEIFSKHFEADIIIQSFYALNWLGNKSESFVQLPAFEGHSFEDFRELYLLLYKKWNIGFVWCRAFKRSIIKRYSLHFDEDYVLREDELFVFQYMKFVKSFSLCDIGGYHYLSPDYTAKYNDKMSILINLKFLDKIIRCKKDVIGSYNHPLVKKEINIYSDYIYKLGKYKVWSDNKLQKHIQIFRLYMKALSNTKGILFKTLLLYINAFFAIKLRNIIRKQKQYE